MDMDKAALDSLLQNYKASLTSVRKNEKYKWEAAACFQAHWNLDTEDTADMIRASLKKADNLLTGYLYYPAGMLIEFAKRDPAGTAQALRDLMDENLDLKQRLQDFATAMSAQLTALNNAKAASGEKLANNHYQDARAMSVYLGLAHTESHYLYKAGMYRMFAKRIGVKVPGDKFDKLVSYEELCNEVLRVLESEYPDIIELSDDRLSDELRKVDPAHHLLVQDIAWFANSYDDAEIDDVKELPEDDKPGDKPVIDAPLASSATEEEAESYTDADFLAEVFCGRDDLEAMKGLLRRKKNLILQGAPGTGKTFTSKRLAWAVMGEKDTSRLEMVQFHQNTTYDDLVYGWRPAEGGGYELMPGTFVRFCRKAAAHPDEPFFFIIDEINRANISKVFGELLMLIEADHRGDAIILPVSGERFSVPPNVYIVGMMNTADRGLALIDYALRRRFAFFEMVPALENDHFKRAVKEAGGKMPALVEAVSKLNEVIAADPALGPGFRIGHSYFCVEPKVSDDVAASIVRFELAPLVDEYWFDDLDKAGAEKAKLQAAVK